MALHLRHDWPGMRPDYVDYVEVPWCQALGHVQHHMCHTQVAIMSAKQNAPSLVPILIYDGPPGSLTAWVERLGGKVIFHYLTFYQDLKDFESRGVLQKVRIQMLLFRRKTSSCPGLCAERAGHLLAHGHRPLPP